MDIGFIHVLFGIISLITGLIVLISYAFITGLRKPPGMLIFWQTVLQVILDFEWGVMGLYDHSLSKQISDDACQIIGFIIIYCFFVGWSYISCLVYELIVKLKDPMNGNYKKRSPIYHLISHLTGAFFTIYAGVRNQTGNNILQICYLNADARFLVIFPMCTFYPAVIIGLIYLTSLIKISTSKLTKKYMRLYFMSIFVYTWLWVLISSCLIANDDNSELNGIAEIVGSFSGIIVNVLRICDPAFWNYVRSRVHRPKRKESLARFHSVYESSYIQMITSVFSAAVLKSIISLNLTLGVEEETEYEDIEWTQEHYDQKERYMFDHKDLEHILIPENISYLTYEYKCSVSVHAPMVFQSIRNLCEISSESICKSFDIYENLETLKTNAGNEGGRSASFFYFSKDKKFLIKTISRSEKKVLINKLLPDMHKHLIMSPDSILSKVIGVFSFKFPDNNKIRVMLQSNIFPPVQMNGIFDLKGSKLDRSANKSSVGSISITSNKIYKDLDFLCAIKKISIEEVDIRRLKYNIYKDSEFLCKHNIIDYSLLLGISEEFQSKFKPLIGCNENKGLFYYVGIIDYLQTYNTFKQLEAFSKNIVLLNVPREDISVISPDIYNDRFVSFINSIIS